MAVLDRLAVVVEFKSAAVSWLSRYGTILALILLILFNLAFTANFATWQTLNINLTQVSTILIVAIGMTLVIGSGGIDLSVGSLMAISGAIAPLIFLNHIVQLPNIYVGVALAFTLPVLLAGLFGFFNGWLITRYKVQPIVATLILFIAGRGIAQSFTDSNQVIFTTPEFQFIGLGRLVGVPVQVIIMSVIVATGVWAVGRTIFGKHLLAVGGNEAAARLAGVRVDRIKLQVSSVLDFKVATNPAVVVNNLDWTSPLSAIEFLRDIGKHFSVNQMLSKDSVANRLEGGISYTEFSYQVLQAFDYLELYRRYNCTLQLGGSDQWGNIVAGLDLIRRVESGSGHALTVPLLTKADGTKFGKSAGGSIWLDPEMTSPYAFFQYWLNSDDKDVINFLKLFSFNSRQEIEEIEKEHNENPGARNAHRALARELTALIHGEETSARVEEAAKALFGQGDLNTLDEKTLASALSELPRVQISSNEEIPTWVDLLAAAGVVDSKSAARRIVKEGGAYLNNEKISGEDFRLEKSHFLCGKYAVLRKGKRDLAAVELV